MASTRERDAFPKMLSRCTRLMFSSTEAPTSQWESSVFVSPIKAPALIILDEYSDEDRSRFFSSIALAGMVLTYRLSYFQSCLRLLAITSFRSADMKAPAARCLFSSMLGCGRRGRPQHNPAPEQVHRVLVPGLPSLKDRSFPRHVSLPYAHRHGDSP
jgi:hypothetical protein